MNTNNENSEKQQDEILAESIKESGSATVIGREHAIHCLTIIGQIEGHMVLPSQNKSTKYEHLIPQIAAIEESPDIDGLLILLNTVGGDVEAGLAIAEMIAGMQKPTVSLVLGGGHSIGVPLAVSAKYSFIAPSASMTLHPVRLNGLVLGVPQTMTYLEKIEDRIVGFITGHSQISSSRLRELMTNTGELLNDIGSIVSGEDAANWGLVDAQGTLHDALTCLHDMIKKDKEEPDDTHIKTL